MFKVLLLSSVIRRKDRRQKYQVSRFTVSLFFASNNLSIPQLIKLTIRQTYEYQDSNIIMTRPKKG